MDVAAYSEKLTGIEAIDRFIAMEFTPCEAIDNQENVVWMHLLVALSFMQRNGHSCLSLVDIAGQTLFASTTAHISDASCDEKSQSGYTFPALTQIISVVKKALQNSKVAPFFVYQSGNFYTRRYYEFEQEIARDIAARSDFSPLSEEAVSNVKALWPTMFPTAIMSEQDWQQVAVAKSVVQRFSVINGGPGTGKTYTVLRLILALLACDASQKIVLAAPTGKAQQRMTESIVGNLEVLRGKVDDALLDKVPTDAVTIHRLLGLREYTVQTKHNKLNPLMLDVLIVDEASMVDLALMTRIIRAMPAHARLYFIGDADQLPAVELGNVLEQLVQSSGNDILDTGTLDSNGEGSKRDTQLIGVVPNILRQHVAKLCPHLPLLPVDEKAKSWVHTLQAPQRFKGQVAEVATAIQGGRSEIALNAINTAPSLSSTDDNRLVDGVYLCPESTFSNTQLRALARESYAPIFKASSAEEALMMLNRVRWLTPVRKGEMGVEGLNALVFDAVKHLVKRREGSFYQGQPIMIVKNHHPQRLSNGEVGIVWPDDNGKLCAWFEMKTGALRSISLSRIPAFETVFTMTIHKSQGSEFNYVVLFLPLPESEKAAALLHRGLVYTGLTRAREGCLIIANLHTFKAMVEKRDKRYSGLADSIMRCAQASRF